MLLYPGRHKLILDESGLASLDWASCSSAASSYIKVWFDGELVEDVVVGAHSPHTWWGNNPLLGSKSLKPGSLIEIEVGHDAIMRIEGNLVVQE